MERREHTDICSRGHSFDCARSGYVNLLLPGDKHSKIPGDNQLMVAARRDFLNKGYYQPLSDAICGCLLDCLRNEEPRKAFKILDAGCGEGYYTTRIHQALAGQGIPFRLFGVDISKIALDKAAKRESQIEFAVASVFRLPVADVYCDVLLNLFAPYCADETKRVVREDGYLLLVIPGERHLLELKKAVYDVPYENEVKETALEGFSLAERRSLTYLMHLPCGEDIENLFEMTPYYYKTGKEDQQRLRRLLSLEVTASFDILVYKRRGSGKQ